MRNRGIFLVAVSLLCFTFSISGMESENKEKDNYSYMTIKSPSGDQQVVNLLNDSTSRRTSFERDIARRMVENTHIIYPSGRRQTSAANDSVKELISTFYENQFRHSQDPLAPYFMFMSRDAKMAMGIGGVIKMKAWYDFNGSIDSNGFAPYLIPVPRQPDQLRGLGYTPSGTAIFFTILGNHTAIGNYMGYIEANFNGYNHSDFRLKRAYLTINDFTAGYTSSTFSDPAAEPPVIDGAGPNGTISKTNMLVRWLKTFSNRFSFCGSVEFPGSNIATDEYTKKLKDFTPDLVVMTQYQWDNSLSHVRLSGLFRTLAYRDLVIARNRTKLGWGVQLSCVAKAANPLTLYGLASIGQGHASYSGDLSSGPNDLLPTPGVNGQMYAPTALSFVAGVKYSFLENLFMSIALSELRAFTKAGSSAETYKYGLYGSANLIWNLTPRLRIGGEYLIGKRVNINGESGNANRIEAYFQVSF